MPLRHAIEVADFTDEEGGLVGSRAILMAAVLTIDAGRLGR
jgi:hypothetical protein